jgi:hypothetical protein
MLCRRRKSVEAGHETSQNNDESGTTVSAMCLTFI